MSSGFLRLALAGLMWMSAATMSTPLAEPLPEPTPATPLEVITINHATSTCIGNPVTPLCAVETLLACFVRGGATICHEVIHDKRLADRRASLRHPDEITKYRVLSLERLNVGVNPPSEWDPQGVYVWIPGDVRIVLEQYECHVSDPTCETNELYSSGVVIYIVRQQDRHWWVRDWGTPGR